MRPFRIIRYAGEVVLAVFGLVSIPLLPRPVVLFLANRLGSLGYRCAWKLRRIATANLTLAFGDSYSSSEKKQIVRESFANFALVILDLFWFSAWPRKRIERYFVFDPSFVAYFRNQPVITVTAHFGNWEIMGKAAALRGYPCLTVAAALENPGINLVLSRIRTATGQRVVERDGAMRHIVRELKAGGRVALVADQNVLPSEGGEFMNVFDVPAPVSKAPASLSSRLNAPIVPVFCASVGRGHYKAYALPAMRSGKDEPEDRLTRAFIAALEQEIRRRPACWLWMYKRWKYIAPGTDRSRYPFYARAMTAKEESAKQEPDFAPIASSGKARSTDR